MSNEPEYKIRMTVTCPDGAVCWAELESEQKAFEQLTRMELNTVTEIMMGKLKERIPSIQL